MSLGQANMRARYFNGGPGVLLSGLVWLAAALTTLIVEFQPGLIVFFVGGMFIHPGASMICGMLSSDKIQPDKTLTRVPVLTLPILFGGLFLAFVVSFQNPLAFYPIMAVAIGGRYLAFRWIYGLDVYLCFGAILILVGAGAYAMMLTPSRSALIVGMIEFAFGLSLCLRPRHTG